MKKWIMRIRGAVGMALTWAVAWTGLGIIPVLVFGGSEFGLGIELAIYAAMGFVGGGIFSTAIGLAEGRKRFDEMSLPRFAGWGAVGGLLLTGILFSISTALGGNVPLVDFLLNASVLALFGAGSAAGSLALARRAEDRELLEAGEKALGLIEAE